MATQELESPELVCTVSSVTVFLDRAMITRKGKLQLGKQTKRVHLIGFPGNSMDPETMRVGCEGETDMRILDFKLETKMYSEVPDDIISNLEKNKQTLEDQLVDMQDKLNVVAHQIRFVESIPADQKTEDSGAILRRLKPSEWVEMTEYLSTQLGALHTKRRQIEREMREAQNNLQVAIAELYRHQGATQRTRQQVTVEVCVEEDGEFEFEVSYLDHSANWRPTYDARVNSLSKKVEISYLGVVNQFTGEDWSNVEIMLSTASPHLGGTAPTLHAWYVQQEQPLQAVHYQSMACAPMMCCDVPMPCGAPPPPPGARASRKAVMVSAEVQPGQGSNVVFRPNGKNSIPTGGDPTKLLIMRHELGNHFNYMTVPKLGEKVYLNAEVTNTTDYPLLTGRITLFLDNNFVGYASLSRLVLPGETFDLQLGIDESIRVSYKLKQKTSGEKGIFSKNKTQEHAYEIVLESFRDCDEVVIVRDQIPVSQDERIKVDVLEMVPEENKDKNEDEHEKGVVEWKVVLESKSKTRLQLAYRISYPRDLSVSGLNG